MEKQQRGSLGGVELRVTNAGRGIAAQMATSTGPLKFRKEYLNDGGGTFGTGGADQGPRRMEEAKGRKELGRKKKSCRIKIARGWEGKGEANWDAL